MAELKQFPEESQAAPAVYQRVSGFAIAGFIVSAIFAADVSIEAVLGVWNRSPVLIHPMMQMVAAIGLVLSVIALIVIKRSEGTLAGHGLAVGGAGLSVVFGLGYVAYYWATYFATCQQADTFVKAWFNKLAEGKTIHAFLDTELPGIRLRTNPDNLAEIIQRFNQPMRPPGTSATSAKGKLYIFRDTDFVKAVNQARADARIESLGVSDWDYKTGVYKIRRMYRITTPEASYDVHLITLGSESGDRHEFEGRLWSLDFPQSKAERTTATEFGAKVQRIRKESSKFANDWMIRVLERRLSNAYLETLRPEKRTSLRSALTLGLVGGLFAGPVLPGAGGPAGVALRLSSSADSELARQLYLANKGDSAEQGYAGSFHNLGLLDTRDLQTTDPAGRDVVLTALRELFAVPGSELRVGGIEVGADSSRKRWELDSEGRMISPHTLKFMVGPRLAERGVGQAFAVETIITTESSPGVFEASEDPTWRVLRIELVKIDETVIPGVSRPPPGPGRPRR